MSDITESSISTERETKEPNQEHNNEKSTIGSAILGRVHINLADAQWVARNLSPEANISQPDATITKGHNDDHMFSACLLQFMLVLVMALHNPAISHDFLRVFKLLF